MARVVTEPGDLATGRIEMKWPAGARWRRAALIYLIAFAVMMVGLVFVLIGQAMSVRDWQSTTGIVLFVVGQLVITSIAFASRRYSGEPIGPGWAGYHHSWTRLSSGRAISEAVLAVRHRNET